MMWRKLSDYCIQSDCGRYKISKHSLGSSELYGVWVGDESLGYYPNGNEARKAAKKHSEGNSATQHATNATTTQRRGQRCDMTPRGP